MISTWFRVLRPKDSSQLPRESASDSRKSIVGGVVLIDAADVENVMHVCAAGGLRKVQVKGIARGLFDDNNGACKVWCQG